MQWISLDNLQLVSSDATNYLAIADDNGGFIIQRAIHPTW